MPTFPCTACQKTIRVADQYAGRKVRCPACQEPLRVPAAAQAPAAASAPTLDLSALDAADHTPSARRLRHILIGCGSCQKTIKLPESRMGGVAPCPKCKTPLQIDRFELSKAKGDLIDLSHLELEPGDPLADTGSFGSTLGGSAVSGGTGFGSTAGGTAFGSGGTKSGESFAASAGLGGQSSDSQTQMRELRELNDLKHSGAISNEEYRRRKAEIYSGRTLALQAMSRSADGSGPRDRPALGRDAGGGLPGPVKALLAVVVLGAAAFAAFQYLSATPDDDPTTATGDTPAASDPEVAQASPVPVDPPAATSIFDVPDENESSPREDDSETPTPDRSPAPVESGTSSADAQLPAETAIPDDPASPPDSDASADPMPVEEMTTTTLEPEPPAMTIVGWPIEWTDYQPQSNEAIAKACDVIKRILVRDDSALIGVDLGPPAEDVKDLVYRQYRREMYEILLTTAEDAGILDSLIIRDGEETFPVNGLICHRMNVSMRGRSSDQAVILTGVQDGYSVSYWFAGARRAYPEFLDAVGKAQIGEGSPRPVSSPGPPEGF
jgi:hypothetical protein